MALHFLECFYELLQIFCIEHDGGLLAAARLLAYLEELTVAALLQIDVERALTTMNGNAVYFVSKTAVTAATALWSAGRLLLLFTGIVGLTTGKFGHWIEHRKNG